MPRWSSAISYTLFTVTSDEHELTGDAVSLHTRFCYIAFRDYLQSISHLGYLTLLILGARLNLKPINFLLVPGPPLMREHLEAIEVRTW